MTKHFWGWPIASYLFLGSLGNGIMFVVMLFQFAFGGLGTALPLAVTVAIVSLGVGCLLLIFELGQPQLFTRVFIKASALIKWGAVMLSVTMIASLMWLLPFLPWSWCQALAPARDVFLALAGISGLCYVFYAGAELATMTSRSFWANPALPTLSAASGLTTACAVVLLTAGVWPADWPGGIAAEMASAAVCAQAQKMAIVLLTAQLIFLLVYVLMILAFGSATGKKVARRWVSGSYAALFWGVLVAASSCLPILLLALWVAVPLAAATVLVGGAVFRFMLVYSDDRQHVPGEERFESRLPQGGEEFLAAWTDKEDLY